MKPLLATLLCLLCTHIFSQDSLQMQTKLIEAEGRKLYRSEMASWYGTDVFLEKFADQNKIGGYFSYLDGETARCVFYAKGEAPKVIGTIDFDSSYNVKTAVADLAERTFTPLEQQLFELRRNAYEIVQADSFFTTPASTNLNIIPIIGNGEKKVYVLTGAKENGVVIFGNDYLLTFSQTNDLLDKKRLHMNVIPVRYDSPTPEGQVAVGTMHSHGPSTSPFMTATDVCTLLLYQRFTPWQHHQVVSKDYLSIWNCTDSRLNIIPMEVMKKIEKDQGKRRKARIEP